MDPNQALAILQQACPQISTTLAQHQLIQQALSTLREALIPDPVPNPVPGIHESEASLYVGSDHPDRVEANSRLPQ